MIHAPGHPPNTLAISNVFSGMRRRPVAAARLSIVYRIAVSVLAKMMTTAMMVSFVTWRRLGGFGFQLDPVTSSTDPFLIHRMSSRSQKDRSNPGFGSGILSTPEKSVTEKSASSTARPNRPSGNQDWLARVPYPGGLPGDRPLDIDNYFAQLTIWLDLEAEAERERLAMRRQMKSREDVERTGESIVGLELTDTHTGLAGRYLLDMAKPAARELPMNRLKVGSPVVITFDDDPSDEGVPGVVSRRKNHSIQIATERLPERSEKPTTGRRGSGKRGIGQHGKSTASRAGSSLYRLDMSPDETTRKRQLAAMAIAQSAGKRTGRLRDVLLGIRHPRFDGRSIQDGPVSGSAITDTLADIDFVTELNPPQREAVAFALLADDVAVLHGPPGTGKTTTLTEVIIQAVRRGDRVLACAASNTAVDNLLERLVDHLPHVVRVGHPARVMEWLREHTLDALVEADPTADVIKDLRRELETILRQLARLSGDREDRKERRVLQSEAGSLRGQIRGIERTIVRGVLESADVICTTTTIDEDLLGDAAFDLVVVDEACQCTEPGIWQAILRAQRVVLAGDHCQLPPTVLSDQATRIGMRESLMQRLVERFGPSVYRRLTVQYRMHEDIMRFSSDHFYEGTLIADASVRHHRLCDLPNVETTDSSESVLLYIDTAGAGMDEQKEPDGESKMNLGEATIIVELVRELTSAGTRADQIAIIAPYAAQVRCLRSRLDFDGLEIDTVDGFQGREKEVVILSMVRSNAIGEIGFLADRRRSNVAMTRARRKLIMVGDSATLGVNEFYNSVLDYFEMKNAYQSVFARTATD